MHRECLFSIPVVFKQGQCGGHVAEYDCFALVDTGSTISIVSVGVALDAGFNWDRTKSVQFIASDGEKSSTLGSFVASVSSKGRHLVEVEVHVSDDLPLSALLGMNFLKFCNINNPMRQIELKNGKTSCHIPMLKDHDKRMWRAENFIPKLHHQVNNAMRQFLTAAIQNDTRTYDKIMKTEEFPPQEGKFNMSMFKASAFGEFDQAVRQKLEGLLDKYQAVFEIEDNDTLYRGDNCRKLDLQLTSNTYSRPKKLVEVPERAKEQFQEQVDEWLRKGIIEKQTKPVPYLNSFVLVKKPNGKIRFCLDCRHLNSTVEYETVQLEPVDELAVKISCFPIFTHVDISNFYLSFPVSERTSDFLTFQGPQGNYYKFCRSIFGLRGSASHSINQTREALTQLKIFNVRLFVYCDDIILANETHEQMLEDLETLLQFMVKVNFKMKAAKSKFGLAKISLFGFEVSHRKVVIDPERKNALLKIPAPKNKKCLLSHLGSLGYYRRNFPPEAPLAKFQSLFRHLIAANEFEWTEDDSKNWVKMHEALADSIARASIEKSDDVVFLKCDASKEYCGWILTVIRNKIEVIISAGSKVFPPSYAKFNSARLELIGALLALKANFPVLYMRQTIVVTDNPSVYHILNNLDSVAIVEPSLIGRLFQAVSLLQFSAKKSRNSESQWPLVDALSRNERKFIISARNISELLQDYDMVMKSSSTWEKEAVLVSSTALVKDLGVEDLKFLDTVLEDCPVKVLQVLNRVVAEVQADPMFEKFGVVAKKYQERVVVAAHKLGHIGIVKMTSLLNHLNLKWRNRSVTLTSILRQCHVCTTVKARTQGLAVQQAVYSTTTPMSHVSIDLNVIGQGEDAVNLLVIIDMATDYVWVRKVNKPVTARNVLRVLFDFMVSWAPTLKRITLDNGAQFRSELFQAAMKDVDVRLSFVARYSSRGNGRCELANKRLNNMLRLKRINPDDPGFNIKLQAAVSSINLEINGKTKLSPFNLMFGIDPYTNNKKLPELSDDCPMFKAKAQLFRELKQAYSGYPQLFPELAYRVNDLVRILVVQKKGENKITRLKFSSTLYRIMNVNLQALTYKLCPVDDPNNESKHIISHHRHLKMIKPESQPTNLYEVKKLSGQTNKGATDFNTNGVNIGDFKKDDLDGDSEPGSMRSAAARTNGVGSSKCQDAQPHVDEFSRKGVDLQTVSDGCKSPGKAGGASNYRANLPISGGSAVVSRGETEAKPEDQLGEIMLLEPTGAPGDSWVFSCRISDYIVKALGKDNADVIVAIPNYRRKTLHKAAKVAAGCIQFKFGCKDYACISKEVGRRVTNMRVYFRIIVDDRLVWSRPYVISSKQWKRLKPKDGEWSLDQDACNEAQAGIQPKKKVRFKKQRCRHCKLFDCDGSC